MTERNYWIVSPNVKNNEEENNWKHFLSSKPYSFIGWDSDNKYGNTFINIIKRGECHNKCTKKKLDTKCIWNRDSKNR